jgi:hypothetical protein
MWRTAEMLVILPVSISSHYAEIVEAIRLGTMASTNLQTAALSQPKFGIIGVPALLASTIF